MGRGKVPKADRVAPSFAPRATPRQPSPPSVFAKHPFLVVENARTELQAFEFSRWKARRTMVGTSSFLSPLRLGDPLPPCRRSNGNNSSSSAKSTFPQTFQGKP